MKTLKTSEIHLRDPFVMPRDGKYYLYGTRGQTAIGPAEKLECFVGTDLSNWEGPIEVFRAPADFWACENFWAPEVHEYEGAFYMFVTFGAPGRELGTQILRSELPTGPFLPHSDGPLTPHDWGCLDGTLYQENDRIYMVFCHEWRQIHDGAICAIELSRDLKTTIGEPVTLFRASENPNAIPLSNHPPLAHLALTSNDFVTDGPFFHRTENGDLLMLWSSFGKDGYFQAIARSSNGTLFGNWTHDDDLLFATNGGHGMVFRAFDGKLMLAMHSPNEGPLERPMFFELSEIDNTLTVM